MMQKIAQLLIAPFDRVCNRLFGSDYNPLYRSGTIAVLLMTIVTITGLYLVFFYRLGEPYESVVDIHNQVWMGRWIRTLHRYASDATVVAVTVHIVRMMAMGRSWGPRTFAWITGVILLVFLFISGWTGYVMVWDEAAQAIAVAGARLFDTLNLFPDPVSRSFSGSMPMPPASFFFLNLFLHIVVPLGMIFGVWVHTKKLARSVWFPHPRLTYGFTGLLIFISIIWAAPLGRKADLLKIPSDAPYDWLFNFWLSWSESSPGLILAGSVLLFGFLVAVPLLSRPPKKEISKPSFNDQRRCHGCVQCVKDCPYEAISMTPRLIGKGSDEVAMVNPALCVSCGLCVASCGPLSIGPPDRRGIDQINAAKKFVAALKAQPESKSKKMLIIGCRNQPVVLRNIQNFASGAGTDFDVYPVTCAGTVHHATIEHLAEGFERIAVAACPDRNCSTRDGFLLLSDRVSGRREPPFSPQFDKSRLTVHAVGDGEENSFFSEIWAITNQTPAPSRLTRPILALLSGFGLLLATFALSRIDLGSGPQDGYLRLSWRLSGQSIKTCRAKTSEEEAQLPRHMQPPEICDYQPLSYRLVVDVGGLERVNKVVQPGGLRHDRPIYVDENLALPPGAHQVRIQFTPLADGDHAGESFEFSSLINARSGRASLVDISADQTSLILKEGVN